MDIIWYAIGDFFKLCFTVVPFFGSFLNVVLIFIGFCATAYWLNYMKNHKTVENWD